MQALSDMYKKYRLNLVSLRNLLDSLLNFDLKSKSFWRSCGWFNLIYTNNIQTKSTGFFYYIHFSKTSWNSLFPPLAIFRIYSKFSDFRSHYCIFLVKKVIFSIFSDFRLQYLLCCLRS